MVRRRNVLRGQTYSACPQVLGTLHAVELDFHIAFCSVLQIYTDGLQPFSAFTKCFCKNSFASLPVYKEGIFQILEVRKLIKIRPFFVIFCFWFFFLSAVSSSYFFLMPCQFNFLASQCVPHLAKSTLWHGSDCQPKAVCFACPDSF